MSLENIKYKYSISLSEIPEEFIINIYIHEYIHEYSMGCYIPHQIEFEENRNDFDRWLIQNYPELENEKILIHLDY